MEIGIDIEKNYRFKNKSAEHLKRIFTEKEIAYATSHKNSHIHFCALWCVKEAFVKATKTKKITFTSIETLHNDDGSPYIFVNEEIEKILKANNCFTVKISISHTSTHSTAVCLIY